MIKRYIQELKYNRYILVSHPERHPYPTLRHSRGYRIRQGVETGRVSG